MWFSKKIKELQNRPYEAKIRIIWIAVIITSVIVIGLWLVTWKFRKMENNIDGSRFAPLKESFKELKDLKFRD